MSKVLILDMELPNAQQGEIVDYIVGQSIPSIGFTDKFGEGIRSDILEKEVVDYI